jgi:hypothetical protein
MKIAFRALLYGGDVEINAQQKADLLSFIHVEGKGFSGADSPGGLA